MENSKFAQTTILGQIDYSTLPPFLRVLLVTDGTVTNILEAFFWEAIRVENQGQREILVQESIPLLDANPGSSLLQREVRLMGTKSNTAYVFARSLIRLEALPEELRKALLQGKIGIGELLRNSNLETYRELIETGEGKDAAAEKNLEQANSPLIYRLYRISIEHKPVMLIAEYFPQEIYR